MTVTDLEREDERNPLVILVVDLLIAIHPGSHSVVDEVLVESSLNNHKVLSAHLSLSTELTSKCLGRVKVELIQQYLLRTLSFTIVLSPPFMH